MQRTIGRPAETSGLGFFTGADVTLRFLPAPPGHGIAFRRVDLAGSEPVPALIDYAVPRERRTAIEHRGTTVEMIEHVMAALAGLQIDNCLIEIDAPEPPGGDGSALIFVEALQNAGTVEQDRPRRMLRIDAPLRVAAADGGSEIAARPLARSALVISCELDYGADSPVRPQTLSLEITPQSFVEETAFARTFVLESDVESLLDRGYGSRLSARDLLVFGEEGVIDNRLRAADECVRHKILDCLGDFALIGCDLAGHFSAHRSGHSLNRELVRRLRQAYRGFFGGGHSRAA